MDVRDEVLAEREMFVIMSRFLVYTEFKSKSWSREKYQNFGFEYDGFSCGISC